MKKQLSFQLATLVLIGLFAVCAQAQSRSGQQLTVDIPFAFNVGNAELAAGQYTVKIVNPSSDRAVLQIRDAKGQSSALVATTDVAGWSSKNARLTFRQYGSQYFLAQVWMAGDATGLKTNSSSAERAASKQVAKNEKASSLVAVDAK